MSGIERQHMLGYVRVSTDEQARSGLGWEAQESALKAEAERRDWELTILRDEGASGEAGKPRSTECFGTVGCWLGGRACRRQDGPHQPFATARGGDPGHPQVAGLGARRAGPRGRPDHSGRPRPGRNDGGVRGVRARADPGTDTRSSRSRQGTRHEAGPSQHDSNAPVARRIVEMREAGLSYGVIAQALTDDQVLSPAGRPTWQASTVRRFCNSVELAKAVA